MKYLKEGLSSENDNLLMKTYYTLSDSYYFEGAIDSAIYFLEKSYPLAKKQNDLFSVKIIIDDFDSIYSYDIVDFEKRLNYFDDVIDLFAISEPIYTADIFHSKGIIYHYQNKFDESIQALEKSKKLWANYVPGYQTV